MPDVFVNYRVHDQPGYAVLVHRELIAHFGADRVFFDSNSIRPGEDFISVILDALRACAVLLVIIGDEWVRLLGRAEPDWVLLEIAEAVERDIRVIPVLVEDAALPRTRQLPPDIAVLARFQYLRLRRRSIDADLATLIGEVKRIVPALNDRSVRAPAVRRLYRPPVSSCLIGVIPGSIKQVRDVDVWVNSENTEFEMARPTEFSVSAIVRYWGAVRDASGRIVDDVIADELRAEVAGSGPFAPGTTVVTGAGALAATHNVTHVVHVAAVHGEPGAGFRQVRDVEWSVANVLRRAEELAITEGARSVLFPMLGVGMAGAQPGPTAASMLAGMLGYLSEHPNTLLERIYVLGYTGAELSALKSVLAGLPEVRQE